MGQTIEVLIQSFDGAQASRYTGAAATTIYLYSILLTLDLEVEYIWSCLSFNLPTLLYIINRYICLAFFLVAMYDVAGPRGSFSKDYCKNLVNTIGFMLAYTGWTGIMTLRVCAIWRQRTQLVRFTRILWFCVLCTTHVLGYFSYQERLKTVYYDPNMQICIVTTNQRLLKAAIIIPAVYELYLTILTIIKAFDFVFSTPFSTIPLLYRVLARDGVAYFIISMTMTGINLIGWYCLSSNYLYLLRSLYWAIMSTCLAQLVLNLKDVHDRSIREQLETEGVSVSITVAHPIQLHSLGSGGSFLTGLQDLGVDPAKQARNLPRADLEHSGDAPSLRFTRTASSSPRRSMDGTQKNDAVRESA